MQTNQANNGQSELTPAQDKFLQALLQAPNQKAAADASGISARTASRYLNDAAFKSAYDQARLSMLSDAMEYVQVQSVKSLDVIIQLRDDIETPAPTRLKAAHILASRIIDPKMEAPAQPLQGVSGQVDSALLPYLTADELSMIASFVEQAQARKEQAEQAQAQETERRR